MMKKGTHILFLMEKVTHAVSPSDTPRKELVEVPAVYLAESEERCAICHEPRQGLSPRNGHSRDGKRRHGFQPETGHTIEVHYPPSKGYPEGQTETRHHVMQGDTANCWKET